METPQMIDKYILKFCEIIDNFFESIAKILESKFTKRKKKKNVK